MSRPERPSFHLRLPPDLKARLEASRGARSINREIVERLERSYGADLANQFGEIFRLQLSALSESDREKVVALARAIAEILAGNADKTSD